MVWWREARDARTHYQQYLAWFGHTELGIVYSAENLVGNERPNNGYRNEAEKSEHSMHHTVGCVAIRLLAPNFYCFTGGPTCVSFNVTRPQTHPPLCRPPTRLLQVKMLQMPPSRSPVRGQIFDRQIKDCSHVNILLRELICMAIPIPFSVWFSSLVSSRLWHNNIIYKFIFCNFFLLSLSFLLQITFVSTSSSTDDDFHLCCDFVWHFDFLSFFLSSANKCRKCNSIWYVPFARS